MKVADIANEIWLENGSPTDTSIPSIAFWVRSNVGKLNTQLYESFYVDPTTLEIFSSDGKEIKIIPVALIKMMYKVYRVDLDIRKLMTSIQLDTVLSAKDQDFSITRLNRSEILKTLSSLKTATLKEMQELIHNYRSYNAAPSQVAGDDDVRGYYVQTSDGFVRGMISPNGF